MREHIQTLFTFKSREFVEKCAHEELDSDLHFKQNPDVLDQYLNLN
jgi:hypothetical protein